jgi:hypothetical protein
MTSQQSNLSANRQAQEEIRNFLRALDSYADRVAHDPELSFEQHRDSMLETGDLPLRRAAASGR